MNAKSAPHLASPAALMPAEKLLFRLPTTLSLLIRPCTRTPHRTRLSYTLHRTDTLQYSNQDDKRWRQVVNVGFRQSIPAVGTITARVTLVHALHSHR